jgi:general stress protein 26
MPVGDSIDQVPSGVVEFLQSHSALTIATSSAAGVPHAATMIYVVDDLTVYFSTNPDTITASHITSNPRVSFAVGEYEQEWEKSRGVQVDGEAEVVISPAEIQHVISLFQAKFPSLRNARASNLSIFRIRPTSIHFVDNAGSGEVAGQTLGTGWRRSLVFNVFRDLPETAMEAVSAQLSATQYGEGDIVVRQGAPADKFFIIASGEVEVVREDLGVSRTIARLGSGQFFGETAILRDAPRNATVRALTNTTLLVMDRDTFRSVVTQSLATSSNFDRVMTERLEELSRAQTED